MRKYVLAGLIAAVPFATPAFAQDAPPSIGGFRVEAVTGYDAAEINDDSDGGLVYGLGVGYDFQVGRRGILGIEAEATESTNDGCVTDFLQPGDSICARAGRDFYVGARAGVMVSNRIQLYARAGYTNARFKLDYEDGTPTTTADFSISDELDGVRVGGGAQYRIGSNAYLGAEYRYSNYEAGSDRGQVVGTLGFRF